MRSHPPLQPSQEGITCCYYATDIFYTSEPTNGKQTNRKAKTSPRRQRGKATPSPSWVLFEADEATTTFSKVRSSNARSDLYRSRASHAEVCELSHDRLFFVSFLLATKEMKGKASKHLLPKSPFMGLGSKKSILLYQAFFIQKESSVPSAFPYLSV